VIDLSGLEHQKILPWSMVGTISVAALGGLIYLVKVLWRNDRARKALGVGLGLDSKPDESISELNKVLIQFVQMQETRSQADHQERTRQWERIEQMVSAIGVQSKETHDLAIGMNSISMHFQQLYSQNEATLQRIEHSQVNLAIWIYQNLGGARSSSPQMPIQQMQAQAGGRS